HLIVRIQLISITNTTPHPTHPHFPYTPLFRSHRAPAAVGGPVLDDVLDHQEIVGEALHADDGELVLEPSPGDRRDGAVAPRRARDRKSTRLNSSHVEISYAVFCLKKKKRSDGR